MNDQSINLGHCADCGEPLVLKTGPGRVREYLRGVWLRIPDDFGTPVCSACGAEHMVPEVSEPLDDLLRKELARQIDLLVTAVRVRDGVTQQDIEDGMGITRSYLSHLRAGRKEPSAPLVKLLQLCAYSSANFLLIREPQPFNITAAVGLLVVGTGRQYRAGNGFRAKQTYAHGEYAVEANDVAPQARRLSS